MSLVTLLVLSYLSPLLPLSHKLSTFSPLNFFFSPRGEFDFGTMNRRVHITGAPANARAAMLLIHAKVQAATLLLMPMGYICDPWMLPGGEPGDQREWTRGDGAMSLGDESLCDTTEGEEEDHEQEEEERLGAAARGSAAAGAAGGQDREPSSMAKMGPENLSFDTLSLAGDTSS